ncbi:MAG: dienelactone hydrolase family protein [Flavobacteriaceae bacterium]|nr:dienelactone hydrolase family protein [Flavobacteriaceae bacterium]
MRCLLVVVVFLFTGLCFGQQYAAEQFEYQNDKLPYRILFPDQYDEKKDYPLLLVLHGAGERGGDNQSQLLHGSETFQAASFRSKYPAIVVFPQCPKNSFWSSMTRNPTDSLDQRFTFINPLPENPQLEIVEALLLHLEEEYRIDPTRRYVGGLSMGGMGTFELVSRNPDYFAAAFPICGGSNTAWAKAMSKTPMWIFHGEKDKVVSANYSKEIFTALKEINAAVRLTLYSEVFHDSWHKAFGDPELMQWLFSNQKKQ